MGSVLLEPEHDGQIRASIPGADLVNVGDQDIVVGRGGGVEAGALALRF